MFTLRPFFKGRSSRCYFFFGIKNGDNYGSFKTLTMGLQLNDTVFAWRENADGTTTNLTPEEIKNFQARYCKGAWGNWYDLKEQKEMPDGWEPAISFVHGNLEKANDYTGTVADVQIKTL